MYFINYFMQSCKKGDLIGAQQILRDNPTFNIYGNDYEHKVVNSAFEFSCYYGQLHVAQWLFLIII